MESQHGKESHQESPKALSLDHFFLSSTCIGDIGTGVLASLIIFTDDTECFDEVKKNTIQKSLDQLHLWSKKLAMEFNVDKSCVIHMGKKNPRKEYFLCEKVLRQLKSERDLGVQMQEDIVFHEQAKIVVNKCQKLTGQIKREPSLMLNIFGVCIWSPWQKRVIDLLESVQRRFTKLIKNIGHLTYEERLKFLGLPTLENRRRYKESKLA